MEGREEGKSEGKIEGMQERNLEIARQMKADGEPVEKIRRYTGLRRRRLRGCRGMDLGLGGVVEIKTVQVGVFRID
jgi:hypothetical protein